MFLVIRPLISLVWLMLVLLHAPVLRANVGQRMPLPCGGDAEAAEAEPPAFGRGGGAQVPEGPSTGRGRATDGSESQGPGDRGPRPYDALGRRVERSKGGITTDRFVYRSALQPLLWTDERVSPAVSSRFVYVRDRNVPDYMIQGARQFWLVTDQVGSVRLVVDMNAAPAKIVQRIDYDAWGNVLRDELYDATVRPVPFRFAGGLWDEDTRLVHFGARDYDPETGRWTSRDPLLFGGGDANLYLYAGGDPVNRVDPSGEFAPAVFAFALAISAAFDVQSSDDAAGLFGALGDALLAEGGYSLGGGALRAAARWGAARGGMAFSAETGAGELFPTLRIPALVSALPPPSWTRMLS